MSYIINYDLFFRYYVGNWVQRFYTQQILYRMEDLKQQKEMVPLYPIYGTNPRTTRKHPKTDNQLKNPIG